MALDGSTIATVLAGLFAIVSSGMGIWAADRRAARKEASEIRAAAAAERQHQSEVEAGKAADMLDRSDSLMKYIDEKVEAATKDLRDELGQVKRLVGSIYGRLSRTREAFRSFVWQVRASWNKTAEPPHLSPEAAELIGEDDLDDTFTAAQIAEIIDPDHVGM